MDLPDLYYKEEDNSEPVSTLPEKRKREENVNLESKSKKSKQDDIVVITLDESDDEVSEKLF
jgi:hypothetical protein